MWIPNLIVYFCFIFLFFAIYQVSILKNLDTFGNDIIFGNGFKIQFLFFIWTTLSIIIVFIFGKIKKFHIKLFPLLLIAIVLPIGVYRVNHHIFITGNGAEYKERKTIAIHIKDWEKALESGNLEDCHESELKKHPIFIAKQENDDFFMS